MTARYRSAVRRVWADGRLPEAVGALFREYWALKLRHALHQVSRALFPPIGLGRPGPVIAIAGQRRRWRVSGDAPISAFELMHDFSRTAVEQLARSGVDLFVVEMDGRRIEFGIPLSQRTAALNALEELGKTDLWYMDWKRGSRTRTRRLGARRKHAAVKGEWWSVYQLFRTGRLGAVGRDQGTLFSFWEDDGLGRLQKIAIRGLARIPSDSRPTVEQIDGRDYPGRESLPVERSLEAFQHPIDVVYTWVDGSDPLWQREYEKARQGMTTSDAAGEHPSRFRSRDELRYSIRSVWLNAGWIRKIFLVTSGQVPEWLAEDDRLEVITHSDIMGPSDLPTFNSHAIESRLHHIKGLAEHFIYMNDDVFIGRPLTPGTFFTANGLIRFTTSHAPVELSSTVVGPAAVDAAARNGRMLIEREFGRRPRHKLDHAPHPLLRSVLFEIEERFEEARATSGHRFRDGRDLAIASGFCQQYSFLTGRALPGDLSTRYVNLENRRFGMVVERILLGRDIDAFCLNETEVDPIGATPDAALISFLDTYFSVQSPWEKGRIRM